MADAPALQRFYCAVLDGRVVASTTTIRQYHYAVVHHGHAGPFVTFHSELAGARRAKQYWTDSAPVKVIVEVVQTKYRVMPGTVLNTSPGGPVLEQLRGMHDEDGADADPTAEVSVEESAERQREILEGIWRQS